ncbi:unnamed protein product, partial [Tuber aestivum]
MAPIRNRQVFLSYRGGGWLAWGNGKKKKRREKKGGKGKGGNVKQLTREPGIEFLISPSSLNDWRFSANDS